MNLDYLDFEQPIAELEQKISELRRMTSNADVNISEEIARLEKKSRELTKNIFSNLSAQQIVQLARHPLRPYTMDYIERIFTDFQPLQGDRHISKAGEVVGGLARLEGEPVMVIGHQKCPTTKEKLEHIFVAALAEVFGLRLPHRRHDVSLGLSTRPGSPIFRTSAQTACVTVRRGPAPAPWHIPPTAHLDTVIFAAAARRRHR